jgi:hypothetical protein
VEVSDCGTLGIQYSAALLFCTVNVAYFFEHANVFVWGEPFILLSFWDFETW